MTTAIIGAGNIGRTIAGQLAAGGRGVRGTRVAGLPHHNSGGFPARAPTPRGPDRRWIASRDAVRSPPFLILSIQPYALLPQ